MDLVLAHWGCCHNTLTRTPLFPRMLFQPPGPLLLGRCQIASRTLSTLRTTGRLVTDLRTNSAAIQAAINAAFTSAGTPNGVNATLNRPLFFPQGHYIVNSTLTFTQVRGAHIYGAGGGVTLIEGIGVGAIATNGMDYCCWENMSVSSSGGSGVAAFELDWNGSGSVGLQSNLFSMVNFGGSSSAKCDYGMRIGFSGNGGSNNQFLQCEMAACNVAGLVTWSSSAVCNLMQGGGPANNPGIGIWMRNGQFSSINNWAPSGNGANSPTTIPGIQIDSGDGPCLLKGVRAEDVLFCVVTNANAIVMMDGCAGSSGTKEMCRTVTGTKLIMDQCETSENSSGTAMLCSDSSGGTVYLRACVFASPTTGYSPPYSYTTPGSGFLTGFAGTVAQAI